MINKVVNILDDENHNLEICKNPNGKYFARYGFAATELFDTQEEAEKVAKELKEDMDNLSDFL